MKPLHKMTYIAAFCKHLCNNYMKYKNVHDENASNVTVISCNNSLMLSNFKHFVGVQWPPVKVYISSQSGCPSRRKVADSSSSPPTTELQNSTRHCWWWICDRKLPQEQSSELGSSLPGTHNCNGDQIMTCNNFISWMSIHVSTISRQRNSNQTTQLHQENL